jgi:Tol biopolymer transport system component
VESLSTFDWNHCPDCVEYAISVGITGCFAFGGGHYSQNEEKIDMRVNGFSPDNQFLSFSYRQGSIFFSGLLDLHSGEVTKIVSPDFDEQWLSGCFSPSGKYLAYAVKRKSENFRWSQLGLYNISTKSFKILTDSEALKDFPSFSPDEKQLIYAQANVERESGKTRFGEWDIYKLDIESGQEERLTNNQFFLIGSPFFLPDGKQFIFSGANPLRFESKTGIITVENYSKYREAKAAYKDKYQDNTIFVFGPKMTELEPAFTNGPYSVSPRISRNGKRIIYMARSDELNRAAGQSTDGFTYDIFMLEDGNHLRLTNLPLSLKSYTMSPDGSLIAYIWESYKQKEEAQHLRILIVDSNQTKDIDILTLIKN